MATTFAEWCAWRKVRGDIDPDVNDPTVPQLIDIYNTQYRAANLVVPPPPVPDVRAGVKRLIPKTQAVVIPETPADRQFLDRKRRGLPNRALWIGKKVFSTGNLATVAHYHYEPGPGLPPIEPKTGVSDIVVKENTHLPPPDELSSEDDILQRLQGSGVHTITSPRKAARYKTLYAPHPKRIFLEYCPLGDMNSQIILRSTDGSSPFSRLSMWKIFECLVDGVCAMQYGRDLLKSGKRYRRLPPDQWLEIIHLDIKPGNLFLADRDINHPLTPVVKYGDFGLSQVVPRARVTSGTAADRAWMTTEVRECAGTTEYFPPELFHKDWDTANWYTSPIAGKFNGETYSQFNIGQIMWQMVTRSDEPPDIKDAERFLPNFTIGGAPPRGLTYGRDLSAAAYELQYGREMIDLIFACLYEDPSHRPRLSELKLRISNGFAEAQKAGAVFEFWDNFLPWPTNQKLETQQCTAIRPTGKRCRRKRRGLPGDPAPRCYDCIAHGRY